MKREFPIPMEKLTNVENQKIEKPSEELQKKLKIAKRAAQEIPDNSCINLGIGLPTFIPQFLEDKEVMLQGENGVLGINGYAFVGKEDPDLIDPAKNTIKVKKGASYFDSVESFGMIRGSHLSCTFLGTMEVSELGNISNWVIPGKKLKGMGGAMDLVGSRAKVIVLTLHENKKGECKLKKECSLPFTGKKVISKVITELGVFEVTERGFKLAEIAEGVTVEEVKRRTPLELLISKDLKTF